MYHIDGYAILVLKPRGSLFLPLKVPIEAWIPNLPISAKSAIYTFQSSTNPSASGVKVCISTESPENHKPPKNTQSKSMLINQERRFPPTPKSAHTLNLTAHHNSINETNH